MSAYIVEESHIRFLVQSALTLSHNGMRFGSRRVTDETADAVGQMLWDENAKSVNARYPRDSQTVGTYTHHYCNLPVRSVEVLKALDCYEYQSCEHDGWESSDAHAFCKALRATATAFLPGYNDAPWGAPQGW